MSQVKQKKSRDRILEASADLFYAHDTHAVGVDAICAAADVSKRTLYKHFPAKTQLIAAALSVQAGDWGEAFAAADTGSTPAERVKAIFVTLESRSKADSFRGCPMMNTSIELRDCNEQAKGIAKDFKNKLCAHFKRQAGLMGSDSPDELAEQLLLLYDGCNAWCVMHGRFPSSVYRAVEALLAGSARQSL